MFTRIDTHVFHSNSLSCGAARRQWAQCLALFTERNAGRPVVVEADLRDLGAVQTEVKSALNGVCYDRRDGTAQIMLGGIGVDEPHRTVVVRDVLAVDSLVTSAGHDVALRFAIPTGQVLLTFVPRFGDDVEGA